MLTHKEFKAKMLKDPVVRAEYDRLQPEMELLDVLLSAREEAGLTQAEVAERMGTKAPAVARLEGALATGKHSPSVATIRQLAACRRDARQGARMRRVAGHTSILATPHGARLQDGQCSSCSFSATKRSNT
ncbi:MAG: helix-turn-helix transcriptional regulator [Betaproteobacteria bacterium]|nr:helix-turn-helix transcriptional regulator [Betaproteobacteria bacterium]